MYYSANTVRFSGNRCRGAGFTRADLLAVVASATLLAALVVVSTTVIHNRQRLSICRSNLQQVGRPILLYAADNTETLPGPTIGQGGDFWWWYKEKVKRYVGLSGSSSSNDSLFACPLDRGYSDLRPFCKAERFDYGSYVFNGVTLPGMPNIARWKVSSINQPQPTLLVMEWAAHAPLSWHRSKTGKANAPFYRDAESVVAFADGHVSFTKMYYDGYNAAYTRDPIPGYDYKYSGD